MGGLGVVAGRPVGVVSGRPVEIEVERATIGHYLQNAGTALALRGTQFPSEESLYGLPARRTGSSGACPPP